MAHRGRAYPLTNHRGFTADAPYPLWAAEGYELWYPLTGTGTWSTTLNGRIVICEHPVVASGYLFYENITPLLSGFSELRTILRIGWTNNEPNLRLWQVVSFLKFFLPLPSEQLLCIWQREAPESTLDGLSQAFIPVLSFPNPSEYDPNGKPAFAIYRPWP